MYLPAQGAILEGGQGQAQAGEEEDQRNAGLVEQLRLQEAAFGPGSRPEEGQGDGDQHALEKPVELEFHGE